VAFQVVLAARAGSPTVEVDVSDLVGPAGRIPRQRIEVLLESYIDCPPSESTRVALAPGEHPDALIPLWQNGPGGPASA
jgi:hypothetical protein